MRDMAHPKTAIVCMVHNGLEYLGEFISYHLLLSDHIYLIDHNSQIDLRQLKLDRVTVVRSNHEAQFQSECTNIVIDHFKIKQKYDWLFVLDIDEFLPFTSKESFHGFLNKHKDAAAIQFHWRNGVPFYDEAESPKSLAECDSIRFFHKESPNHKTFVNITKTKGDFIVPTGAHRIDRTYFSLISKRPFRRKHKRYEAAISEFPLLHIVAFNKNAFIKKIKTYVDQMKYREHIKGQGGWVVRDYPDNFTDEDWLWYIANFRISAPEEFYDSKIEYFLPEPVFDHLNKPDAINLRDKILSFNKTDKKPATVSEKTYLLNKEDDRDVTKNTRWFKIDTENEILTVCPFFYKRKLKSS